MKNNKFIIKRESGFTLIELMTTIAILMVLTMIAIPNFLTWKASYNFRNSLTDLYSNFQRARITAVKQRTLCTVTFNQAVDGETYDYVVFVDRDNDLELDANETGDIIAKVKWENYESVVLGSGGITFPDNDDTLPAIAFRPTGMPRQNTGSIPASSQYSVTLKNTKDGKEKKVEITTIGKISITD